ncbi:hypothetical protein V4B17_06010 [Bartonella sp. B23]
MSAFIGLAGKFSCIKRYVGELVHASGTEPVIRIMAEGDKREVLNDVVTEMIDVLTYHDDFSKVSASWHL